MKFDKFSERLKYIIDTVGVSMNQFEKDCGVAVGTFQKPIKNGTTIGNDKLEAVAKTYPNVNIGWLVAGLGEPFLNKENVLNGKENHNVVNEPPPVYEKIPADLQRKVNFLMEQVQDMSKTLYEVGQKTEKHEEQLKRLTGK